MHPDIAAALEEVERHTAGLTIEHLGKALPGRWTVAEILEHLTLAFRATTRSLEKALASGELRAPAPSPRQWVARSLVVGLGYFPRVKAPENAVPKGIPPERVREELRSALEEVDVSLTAAAQRFGLEARVLRHPYFAGMTVPQWRKFHRRHTAHHMRQVRDRLKR